MPADGVRQLAELIGRGAQGLRLARTLHAEGVRGRAGLRRPDVLARLPRESRASVLYGPIRHAPLREAEALAAELARRLVFPAGPRRCEVVPVGSVRRRAARVKDIDLLVVASARSPDTAGGILSSATLRPAEPGDRAELVAAYAAGGRRRSYVVRSGGRHYRVDLFLALRSEKPYALFHFTGGRDYNIRTRAHAKRRGWLLNQYGLFVARTGARVRGSGALRTERGLARMLGVSYREPAERA